MTWARYVAAACALLAGVIASLFIMRNEQSLLSICIIGFLLCVILVMLILQRRQPEILPLQQKYKSSGRTMDAEDVLKLQLNDLTNKSTKVAYQLASPMNRRSTAADGQGGNHNATAFDAMVRRGFQPLLEADDYAVLPLERTQTHASYNVLLFQSLVPVAAYRFDLSTVNEEDLHESLGNFKILKDSKFWRTDAVKPLERSTFDAIQAAVKSQRQQRFRSLCFGSKDRDQSISHSFGEDSTHNLCCRLGPESKKYADATNNPIGLAAERIDVIGDKTMSNWSTCMGSNVCGAYAARHKDGTKPLFATNQELTMVATDVPPDPNCEAFAAQLLTTPTHSTPGIHTRGDPNLCNEKDKVKKGFLRKQKEVDQWLQRQQTE